MPAIRHRFLVALLPGLLLGLQAPAEELSVVIDSIRWEAHCDGVEDFDGDEDVDQDDFAVLQGCFTGAKKLAHPGCDD